MAFELKGWCTYHSSIHHWYGVTESTLIGHFNIIQVKILKKKNARWIDHYCPISLSICPLALDVTFSCWSPFSASSSRKEWSFEVTIIFLSAQTALNIHLWPLLSPKELLLEKLLLKGNSVWTLEAVLWDVSIRHQDLGSLASTTITTQTFALRCCYVKYKCINQVFLIKVASGCNSIIMHCSMLLL